MHSTWSLLSVMSCSPGIVKNLAEQMLILESVSVRWPLSAMTTLMQQKEKVNICELVWKTITYEHLQRSRLKKRLFGNCQAEDYNYRIKMK